MMPIEEIGTFIPGDLTGSMLYHYRSVPPKRSHLLPRELVQTQLQILFVRVWQYV